MDTMAALTFSIDAELVGGGTAAVTRQHRVKESWQRIIDLFNHYSIPATWAVVSRLCPGLGDQSGKKYLPITDLLDTLLESDTNHEIGSHSHNHLRYTELSRTEARSDLEMSQRTLREIDVTPKSFIYPYNSIAHRDLLADYGFCCYRGETESTNLATSTDSASGSVRRILDIVPETIKAYAVKYWDRSTELVAYIRGVEPPLVTPTLDSNGLVAFPASLASIFRASSSMLDSLRDVNIWPIRTAVKAGIDRAIREDGRVHFWFHPHDLRTERDFECLSDILSIIAKHRASGDLTVEPMSEVAATIHG